MMKFLHKLFSDNNDLNEKSILGYVAFSMMIVVLITDIVMAILSKKFEPHEYIFDAFVITTLGAFGIASIDKWTNFKRSTKSSETSDNIEEEETTK